MAIETYGKMGINITKVTTISDWPANGMPISSPSIVLIKTNDISASGDIWFQLTLDKHEYVQDGTAEWANYMKIIPGEDYYIDLAYSPYSVNFDFSNVDSGNPTIWVRS
jgi:hypothetical protein